MREILLVSKPIERPWNDGSKTLVRDLAGALERYSPVVLGTKDGGYAPLRGRVERVYSGDAGHALGSGAAARVLARLAIGRSPELWHFFFQPNPRTSLTARAIARARRKRTVHTIASAPRHGLDPRRVLFADRSVVLSRATERALEHVPGVVRIAPPVAELAIPSEERRRADRASFDLPSGVPLVVFPGDLERGEGARLAIEAIAAVPDAVLAMAYRSKSGSTHRAEVALRSRAVSEGVADRVHWIGETDRIHALLGCADVVALPSVDLGAKVDLPIVLVEAMWMARAVIVASGSSAEDLAESGGALAVPAERDALSAAIASLAGDVARRAALGEKARACARSRHAPDVVAAAYERLYDEVLG